MPNFPPYPSTGSIFSTSRGAYKYNGYAWDVISPNISVGNPIITGSYNLFSSSYKELSHVGARTLSKITASSLQLDGGFSYTSTDSAINTTGSQVKIFSETGHCEGIALDLKFDGPHVSYNFVDDSPYQHSSSRNNALIQSAGSVIGTSSVFFNGNAWIDIPSSNAWAFGTTQDFTIEFWLKANSLNGVLMDGRTNSVQGPMIDIYLGSGVGNPILYVDSTEIIASSAAFRVGYWGHMAVCRHNGVHTMYLNGKPVGTYSNSVNYTASPLRIGAWSGGEAFNFTGSIDSLKIYKGFAKYTSEFIVHSASSEPNKVLQTHAPTLKIQNRYNNILKEYTVQMTSDNTRMALTGSN